MPSTINSDDGVVSGTAGLKTSGGNDGLLDFQSNGTRIAGITTSAFQVGTDNISSVNSLGFRNRIINGAMVIDQRNAGASVSVNSASGVYTLDRWLGRTPTSAGVFTVQRSTTAPTGFRNSLLCTVTTASTPAASDIYFLQQRIEGFNVADLGFGAAGASSVTVSFWVRSSLTGTFGASIGNNVDQSYPFSFTINAANTFEQKTVTIPGSTTGTWVTDSGIGLLISFSLGAGSSVTGTANTWGNYPYAPTGSVNLIATNGATFYITGVQLEAGSVATPFERRDYGRELMLCQRYYEKSYNQSVVPGTVSDLGAFFTLRIDSVGGGGTSFKVTKRATPTVTVYSPVSGVAGEARNYSTSSNQAASAQSIGEGAFYLLVSSASNNQGLGIQYVASSEL